MKLLLILSILLLQQSLFAFEIHAHRGGSNIHPKNSLNAIIEGLEKGSFASEIDIHLTKDNHFVVTHDPLISLKKCKSPIQNQLNSLVIRNLLLSEVITFKCSNDKLPAQAIPSLEEVLIQTEKFEDQKLNIELKYYNKATRDIYNNHEDELYPSLQILSSELDNLLLKYDAYDRVIIQSFSLDFLILIKSISQTVTTSFLYKGAYIRALPERVIKKNEQVRKYLWVPNYRKAFKVMVAEKFDYFSPTVGQITNVLYRRAFNKHIIKARKKNKAQFKILPWTVNKKEKIKDIKNDLDGVITDIPELFM